MPYLLLFSIQNIYYDNFIVEESKEIVKVNTRSPANEGQDMQFVDIK